MGVYLLFEQLSVRLSPLENPISAERAIPETCFADLIVCFAVFDPAWPITSLKQFRKEIRVD